MNTMHREYRGGHMATKKEKLPVRIVRHTLNLESEWGEKKKSWHCQATKIDREDA